MRHTIRCLAASAAVAAAGAADATWSILLVDLSTGEIAVGSATCLTGFDLQANTPVLIPGVGAATAQSFVDVNGFNRSLIRDRLVEGVPPASILDELSVFDGGHQTRQYGMIDTSGHAATFTGTGAGQWAGGLAGVLEGAGVTGGDVLYAIQGNVLTGEVVVTGALAAVEAEPGDLPAKLLAGMRAARSLGGDGRCSCSPADPTSCGPTPDVFEKSSDIAYMLVGRAGDREGCSPIHRLGGLPVDIESLGDGSFVVSTASRTDMAVVTPGRLASPPTLGEVQRPEIEVDLRKIATGDVTGDGLIDVVGAEAGSSGVWLLASDPAEPGGFAPASRIGESGVDVGLLDAGPSAVVVVADPLERKLIRLLHDGLGGFMPGESFPIGADPESVSVGDIDGDGLPDPAVIARDGTVSTFLLHADRIVTAGPVFQSQIASPTLILIADADRDGRAELVIASRGSPAVEILDAQTGASEGLFNVTSGVRDLRTIETADGPAVFVLGQSGSVVLVPVFPGGPLIFGESLTIRQEPQGVLPIDLDGDGDQDLAVIGSSGQAVRFIDSVAGSFPLTQGCGDGDFFLEFNVAFSAREDPDPVDQLSDLFGAWAFGLIGVPDAVRSSARIVAPFAVSGVGCTTTLRIELRDREGAPASGDAVVVTHADGSEGALAIGETRAIDGSTYEVDLVGTGARGSDRLVVTAFDGGRTVRLMPVLTVSADDPADLDRDGDRDGDDFAAWIAAYQAGDPAADQNGDGLVRPNDLSAWIRNAGVSCE